jgi:hypothetical protein
MPAVSIAGRNVPYALKRFRASKRIRLIVHSDGALTVTAPLRAGLRSVERFIRSQSGWLAGQPHFLGSEAACAKRREAYLREKSAARAFIEGRLAALNAGFGFAWRKVAVRDQRTCWGSCSERGTMSFNWRIIRLPADLADYVIVHELCHLAELNHSRRFWALVERAVPDHGERRRRLKAIPMDAA